MKLFFVIFMTSIATLMHGVSHKNLLKPRFCSSQEIREFSTALYVAAIVKQHTPGSYNNVQRFKKEIVDSEYERTKKLTNNKALIFRCALCSKTHNIRQNLLKHIMYHYKSKDRPFQCKQCSKGFARKDQLKNHIKKGHPH